MADILTRAEIVAQVPSRWAEQYEGLDGDRWASHRETTKQLLALSEGFTAEEVDRIIGNSTWTALSCGECEKQVEAVMCFGVSETMVCEVCIRKAGIALRKAKAGGRS